MSMGVKEWLPHLLFTGPHLVACEGEKDGPLPSFEWRSTAAKAYGAKCREWNWEG